MSLADVPAALKDVAPYVQRAKEVERVDTVVAYWCLYYAAQVGIAEKAQGHDAQTYLLKLMDELERRKAELAESEAVTDETVAYAHLENFALGVFDAADREDAAGRATRSTARAFVTANRLLEVLQVFGAVNEEISTRIRYAKWKAADISKAVREGRKPTPRDGAGPSRDETEDELRQTLESMRVSGATAGAGLDASDDASGPPPSTTGPTEKPSGPDDSASVPLDLPMARASPLDTAGEVNAPESSRDASDAAPGQIAGKHASGKSTPPQATQSGAVQPSAPSGTPPAVSAPSAPALAPEAPVPPKSVPQTGADAPHLDVREQARVQKLTRWVASALDYDDIETARDHLREALAVLDRAVERRTGTAT